jgi:hypothetical protein
MKVFALCVTATILLCRPVRAQDNTVSLAYRQTETKRFVIQLTNRTSAPISAYVVLLRLNFPSRGRGILTEFDDILVNWPGSKSIEPGQTRTIQTGPMEANADAQFAAAIFADGTTTGDPVWIQRLIENRKQVRRDLDKAIPALQSALADGTDIETLKQSFVSFQQQNQQEVREVGETRALEEVASQHVAGSVIGNLEMISKPESFRSVLQWLIGHFQSWQLQLAQSKPRLD